MIGDSATRAPSVGQMEGRRRARAAEREELVVRGASLYSEFLALAELHTELVAASRVAACECRDQVAACARERVPAGEPHGFRRLALLTDERAPTTRFPAAGEERPDAAPSVLALGA